MIDWFNSLPQQLQHMLFWGVFFAIFFIPALVYQFWNEHLAPKKKSDQ